MRTSPIHYIAPSAISIVPNCNGSANDLAVTISRGTKIKVYSPRAGIDKTTNGEYQEWTLTGRNRRLADSTKPYTIYARLSALDNTAYLIFAPMTPQESGEYMSAWTQAYSWVTTDGLYVFGKGTDWEEQRTKTNCIFVRLGDVSLPDANNQRTVTLDTGILGTEQFNDEWALRPDELPLRIELGCTINDEDVGQTPYVYWDQSLVLTAMLTEGWTGTDIQRFDRWEIIRNSGDAAADNTWNYQEVEGQDTLTPRQMPDGQITLQHIFGETDDFNGAVSVTFTILAVGHNADTLQREILKTTTINIMAETVATYELEQSSAAVTYNPLDNTYSPANVVTFRIRTKAQDGSVSFADDSHIAAAQLRLYALPEGDVAENRTRLTFTDGIATLPVTTFVGGKSINLWLENGAQVVLARTTVAYIRYGEKGDTPISIYRWYKVGLTPLKPTSASSEEPAPAAGDATGAANVYPTDKWGKTAPDRPATGEWALWMCGSIRHGNGAIDAWSTPVRISGDKGTAGEDGSDREYIYIRQNTFPFSGTLPASITTPDASSTGQTVADDDFVPNGWSDTALPADNDNRYVYMSVREKPAGEDQTWGPFGNPVLWSNWGVRGTDGDGTEYVFIRTQNNVAPIMDSVQTGYASDEFRPTITSASQTASLTEQAQTTDDPKGPNSTYPYEWVATRSKGDAASDGTRQWTRYTGKNNDFTMSLWSRWAEDGGTQDMRYQWNQSATTAPSFRANEQNPGSGWQPTVPDRPGDGYYLWAISAVKKADGTYGTWGNAIRLTGDKGTAGEDGSDREYIYIRTNAFPFSGTLPASITTPDASSTGQTVADDDFVPNGWSDTALPADNDNRYVYMSVREKPAGENQTWGPFGNPVLWSNWGVRGTDGDSTEYVFIRTKNNVPPIMASEQTGYASDEFRPTITSASQTASLTEQAQTTDDPKGPNSTYPYEWVATRSKDDAASDGTRQWTRYTGKNNDFTMSLWSRWAEDGEPSVSYYIKTDVDSVTIPADSSQIHTMIRGEFHKVTGSTDTVHTCAYVLYARKADGTHVVVAHAPGVQGFSAQIVVTPDIQAYEALMQETLVNDPTVYLARKEIIVQKHGDTGPKGDDAQEVNPNILLRTIFDRGIDFVLEAWTRNSELIAVDGATDTIVNGRKSLRMDASALSQHLDFQQNVFGKVKPSTWYTLSFNYFATQSFYTFLYDASNTTPWIDLSEGYYIDGSATPTAVTRIDGFHEWEADWRGSRHSITFKTASTFSTTTLYVLFRCLQGGQVAICMPKLEEGRVATAYMAHEDDLKGDNAPYNEHAYALSRSRTSHADSDLYQVNGVRWFPSAPDPRATHPYVWERIMHYTAAGVNDRTSYICLTGAVGAMGKLCYIAGEYSEDVEYTSNDSQTVAVEVSGTGETTSIYYLNAESNVVDGRHIGPTDSGQTIWVLGMSQYNLVRARYLFADFAQFGAAVVSGDWLISVHGTINGTAYEGKYTRPDTYINGGDEKPTYFWFDPAYPNEDHAGKYKTPGSSSSGQWGADHHNFIPHYAVNLLTGKTYQNDAYIRGEVYATDGIFNGVVHASDGEFRGKVYASDGEFTGRVVANSGSFSGSSNGFEIKLDADNGKLRIRGPIGVSDRASLTPTPGAIIVDYMSLGEISSNNTQQTINGQLYNFLTTALKMRSYFVEADGSDYIELTLNPMRGLTMKQEYGNGVVNNIEVVYGYTIAKLPSNVSFYAPYALPSRDAASYGQVYLDGETLKVKLSS